MLKLISDNIVKRLQIAGEFSDQISLQAYNLLKLDYKLEEIKLLCISIM
jgi:hypothetical protein